jgi:hypothetical protein
MRVNCGGSRGIARQLVLVTSILLAGCRTPTPPGDLAEFAKAASSISRQAQTVFTDSNKLARSVSAERFIASGQPGLSEDKFLTAVSPGDIAAWQAALSNLEDYGNALASLLDENRGPAISDSLVKVGQNLNANSAGVSISPAVGAGFASLGGAILSAAQHHQARKILQATDPSIQQITHSMAQAIGGTDAEGLRGSVKSNWTASLNPIRADYADAAGKHDLARQRGLVREYLAALDRRDAQLTTLADLRQAIAALGAAHAAAAAGNPKSAGSLLEAVAARAEETRRLYDAFSATAQ